MVKFRVKKLVRDGTIENLTTDNVLVTHRTLSDQEFSTELFRKLVEEAEEVQEALSVEEMIEEIADVQEVLSALMQLHNISQEAVEAKHQQKYRRIG